MKALILDDDMALCKIIASVLDEPNIVYDIFQDPLKAIAAMDVGEYDFAFVDIGLPNMDGLEFSKRFKEKCPHSDIVFVTGYGNYDKAIQAIKIGAYDFLRKPFQRVELSACVARLIEKRNLHEEKKRKEILEFANRMSLELMHELRNPLTAIGGFSKRLSTPNCKQVKMQQYARIVFEESVRLEEVVKRILSHLKTIGKPNMREENAEQRVQSPENKDVVTAVCEVARTMANVPIKESDNQNERGRENMRKAQKEQITTKGKKTAARKATTKKPPSKEVTAMSEIEKEYLKGEEFCKVTFKLPSFSAIDAKNVCIVGDFNNWNIHSDPMEKTRTGDYIITLDLKPGNEYQFRYLIDESEWENDWNADKYVKSPYGDSDNSVVVL
ncbi:MAG: response regulator [Deltaproteobacteria bacterium]|nr:response regulator [Deltaproteobacteria bacterium]